MTDGKCSSHSYGAILTVAGEPGAFFTVQILHIIETWILKCEITLCRALLRGNLAKYAILKGSNGFLATLGSSW